MKSSKRGASTRRRAKQDSREEQVVYDNNNDDYHIGTEAKEYEWNDDDDDDDESYKWTTTNTNDPKTNDVYSVSSSFQDIKEEDETLYEVVGYSTSVSMYILFVFLCIITALFFTTVLFLVTIFVCKVNMQKMQIIKGKIRTHSY